MQGLTSELLSRKQQAANRAGSSNNILVQQAVNFRQEQQWRQTAARPAAAGGAANQPGVQRVQGHPWVTALRSKAESTWDIPSPGAMEEHLVFLFIGASNCVGAVVGSGRATPAVFMRPLSGPAWSCDAAGRCLKRVQEPFHPHDGKGTNGVGSMRAFARRVQRFYPGLGIFIVPGGCSQGEQNIDAWSRDGVMYSIAVARALTCAEAIGGRVAGVVWLQGEADAESKEAAEAYQDKATALMEALRIDLDDPDLIFLTGEIGAKFLSPETQEFPEAYKHAGVVNNALRAATNDHPYCSCVPAPRTYEVDRLHFDADGMEELGNCLGDDWHRHWQKKSRDELRAGPAGEPLTKEQWRKKYKGLKDPRGNAAWASAPRWVEGRQYPGSAPPTTAANGGGAAAGGGARAGLQPGDKVTASGLVGAKELNGLSGSVVSVRADGRVVVAFVGAAGIQEKALKAENLEKARSGPSAGGAAGGAPAGELPNGTVVVPFGLSNASLNGLHGKVFSTRADGMVVVSFDTATLCGEKPIRRENLRMLGEEPPPPAPAAAAPAAPARAPADAPPAEERDRRRRRRDEGADDGDDRDRRRRRRRDDDGEGGDRRRRRRDGEAAAEKRAADDGAESP